MIRHVFHNVVRLVFVAPVLVWLAGLVVLFAVVSLVLSLVDSVLVLRTKRRHYYKGG